MARKIYRLQKRVGSKARIIKPYKIKKTGFEDIGLYARFPWHQTFIDSFVGGWSVALNHPCFNQEIWNTRTIPVIAVNDINSGIIDLAWCLLYIPYNFKMTVKSAIHCQGLWNECRDKALLNRFRSALRFYYSLEANFHKQEFEEGIRKFYENEASYGGTAKGFWIRQNMNRQMGQQLKGVLTEEIENGLRSFYTDESSFRKAGMIGKKFGINKNKNKIHGNFEPHIIDRAPDTPMKDMEEGLRNYYQQEVGFDRKGVGGRNISCRTKKLSGSPRFPKYVTDMDPNIPMEEVEEGLRQWYRTHMAWDRKGDKLTYQVTKTRRPNSDLIPDTDERILEEGLRNWYHNEGRLGPIRPHSGFGLRINKQRGSFYAPHGMDEKKHEEALRRYYHKTHAFGGRNSFQYDIAENRGSLHHGEPLGEEMEDALRRWYFNQHAYSSKNTFRFSQNETRNMNVGSEGGKKDYYDEIHSRLRWMQIFNEGGEGGIYNEDFARFLKRFVGKMDNGFMYLDPPYFKTIDGKHYEDVLTLEQHQQLADLLHEAEKEGTKFLLSYDVDERAEKLYSSFDFETIQVPYSVARSYGDGRAQMDEEYLIRNYNLKEDPYLKKVDFTKKTKLDKFFV